MQGGAEVFEGFAELEKGGGVGAEKSLLFFGDYILCGVLVPCCFAEIVVDGSLHSVTLGSRPKSFMVLSPKPDEIQVGDRMKHESVVPSSCWSLGTIWMALEPLPTTAIFLLRRS